MAASASQGARESEPVTRVTESALRKREDLGRPDREHEDLLRVDLMFIVVVERSVPHQVLPSSVPLRGPGLGKAFEQAYGKLDPKKLYGNLFFAFLGADKVVAPKVVGSYVGGFGTAPGLKTKAATAYRAIMKKYYPKLPADLHARTDRQTSDL